MSLKVPLPDLSELLPQMENDENPAYYASQAVPVLKSSADEHADCFSIYAAQQGMVSMIRGIIASDTPENLALDSTRLATCWTREPRPCICDDSTALELVPSSIVLLLSFVAD